MNCVFMNQDAFSSQWTGIIDTFSVRVLQLFFYSKFFPIFSFLFGLGITMQAMHFIQKNNLKTSFFVRRMFILFVFGILHILLLWSGDVIHLYAILGLLTLVLLKRSNRLIITLALLFLLFPFYDQVAGFIFEVVQYSPEGYLQEYSSEKIITTIRDGNYADGIKFRMKEYLANIPILFVFLAPVALSMFLLGLYFGKNQLVYQLDRVVNRIKKWAILIAVLTNLYRVIFLFVLPHLDIYSNTWLRPLFFKGMFLSDIAMGLFYLWAIAWIWHNTSWKRLLHPLKYVGRMALTNYIMHSFIGLILFSSVGFSMYETLSPAQTLVTALAVFGFQVIFSKVWLTYFKFGPLEWIWRCFSYAKVLPIKKHLNQTT